MPIRAQGTAASCQRDRSAPGNCVMNARPDSQMVRISAQPPTMLRRNPDNKFPSLRRYWQARRFSRSCRRDFADVERYCQFVGFPYSGHSLIGSLLNSHPELVIAHEADALGLLGSCASRDALFEKLMQAEWRFADGDFRWWGYDYSVPGQWQGRYRRLRVIGDKKGGRSARRLQADPVLLDRLRTLLRMPLRLVVNTRNPYDNIARIASRKRLDIEAAIELYFVFAAGVANALERAGPGESIMFRHEEFIAEPAAWLARLAGFLEVDAPADWVTAAAARVFESPRRARDEVEWTAGHHAMVAAGLERFHFLAGYEF